MAATGLQPGIMEDLLWCLINPVYGLARVQETLAAPPPALLAFVLGLLLAIVLPVVRRRCQT
jgi:hypothetical protein